MILLFALRCLNGHLPIFLKVMSTMSESSSSGRAPPWRDKKRLIHFSPHFPIPHTRILLSRDVLVSVHIPEKIAIVFKTVAYRNVKAPEKPNLKVFA